MVNKNVLYLLCMQLMVTGCFLVICLFCDRLKSNVHTKLSKDLDELTKEVWVKSSEMLLKQRLKCLVQAIMRIVVMIK